MCNNCDLVSEMVCRRETSAVRPAREANTDAGIETTTVFRGGAVYTCDPQRPWAQAIAVRGRSIISVGSEDDVLAAAGPVTEVVELQGRMLLPGFVEAHIHPLVGGFLTAGVDLQVSTKAEALAAIADHARSEPTGPIRGFGWRMDMFGPGGPRREDLDAILPDRAALLFAIDAHSLWLNSAALRIAGISVGTPDPVPGFSFFERDATGEPTGFISELPAMLPVIDSIAPMTEDVLGQLLSDWLPKAAAAGITAVFDAGMPPLGDDPTALAGIYTDLEAAGRLPFRVVTSHLVKSPPIGNAVAQARQLRDRLGTELVRGGVLKIFGDGTIEGHTAHLLAPYSDRPDSVGLSPFTEAQWRQLVAEADAAGIDCHIHAIGDRAVRSALDAIEAAIAVNPEWDRRHAVAHLQLVDDADAPRFGELGVIAQFTGNWMSVYPADGVLIERCGTQRESQMYRPRAVLDGGGVVAFGTDWPAAAHTSTYRPLDAIEIAVTRQRVGESGAPVREPRGQRLELTQALHAATLGAARQLRLEHLVGSLEPGKRADLVVLSHNLFEVAPHRLASTTVDLTMMNGRITYAG
ncbi:MAG: amidohydrolase [Actinomycetia bacterium]|nr:amidohydrolase [Actinomycetes bacterium]MCH9761957.1 amidohydrolase [Actinomycetes bacterium]